MFALSPGVNDLSGIEDIVGIKGLFQHAHEIEGVLAMLPDHELLFMQSNSMFARTGSVRINRLRDKLVVQLLGLLPFTFTVGIKQHQHMKITIAHMTHDRAWKTNLRERLSCRVNALG